MQIVIKKVSELIPYVNNARKNDQAVDAVASSIKNYGFKQPIVIDSQGEVIAGHTRLKASQKLGLDEVPCIVADDLTPAQVKAYRIADNKVAELSEWDYELLKLELEDIEGFTGFEVEELENLFEDQKEEKEENFDLDEALNDNYEPITQKGWIYKLGNHRLLCGDSTNDEDVARLMNGQKADMVFTDPPYGMFLETNYDSMFQNDNSRHKTGKRFNKVIGDNEDFTEEFINTIFRNFNETKEIFIWGADYFSELIVNRKDGSWIVWDKRIEENLDKIQGNTFELCWSKQKHKRLIARILWSGHLGMQKEDSKKRIHPTQKPINLIKFFFDNWGKDCKAIVDIFGGSGSTLMACEQTNRSCYMMELDEKYCDVIVKRWEDFTGQKAERIE